MFFIFRK